MSSLWISDQTYVYEITLQIEKKNEFFNNFILRYKIKLQVINSNANGMQLKGQRSSG